jgi:cytidyltransferase-like protein
MSKHIGPYTKEIPDEVVIPGRFQPFTAGHLKAYNEAKKHFSKVSIAMAVRGSGKMDDDNPLTPDQREKLIKKAIPGVTVYRVPNSYWETVFDVIGHPVAIAVGKDREAGMKSMGGSTDGSGKFTIFIVPRSDEDISATKVRNAIRTGDLKTFKAMMPTKVHSEWDNLQKIFKS